MWNELSTDQKQILITPTLTHETARALVREEFFSHNKEKTQGTRVLTKVVARLVEPEAAIAQDYADLIRLYPTEDERCGTHQTRLRNIAIITKEVTRTLSRVDPDSWKMMTQFLYNLHKTAHEDKKVIERGLIIREPQLNDPDRQNEYTAMNQACREDGVTKLLQAGQYLLSQEGTRAFELEAISWALSSFCRYGLRRESEIMEILDRASNGVVSFYSRVLSSSLNVNIANSFFIVVKRGQGSESTGVNA